MINRCKRLILVFALVSSPFALSQSADISGTQELQRQIEVLQAGQQEIKKNLQIVKDILMGKEPPLEDVFIDTAGSRSLGDPRAKIAIVEFSDYQCPFCGQYVKGAYSKVIDGYVTTGRVRYVLRNFPLEQIHPLAEKAAEAAECSGDQGKYWEMHERLFSNQSALESKELSRYAASVGLDLAKFDECLDSGKFAARIKADLKEGAKLSIRGTPTFFFGYTDESDPARVRAVKLLSGAQPLDAFADILDELLNAPQEATRPQ